MQKNTRNPFFALLVCLFVLGIIGCSGTSKTPTFYLLQAMPETSQPLQPQGGISVEVGPITIPAYLERTQIATTGDSHEINMDEFHRWAEPLKDSLGRILSENLAIGLGTANVYQYPMRRSLPIDFQVEVTVSHFLASAEGKVNLVAYWAILDNTGADATPRKRTAISRQATAGGLQAVVDAQNLALQDLSDEITATIQSLL
jgi:uncharacterized lipoprotein YmbA